MSSAPWEGQRPSVSDRERRTGPGDRSSVMEKFLNLVRSNMVQAVLCIAFGLFLMIYPSITVQGIILLLAWRSRSWARQNLCRTSRQRSVRYRDSGRTMSAVFYVIIALIAFIFPKVIAGFFFGGARRGAHLLAIVNVVRAFRLRAFSATASGLPCWRRRCWWVSAVCLSWWPVGRLRDLRARAGRDVHRQRRGGLCSSSGTRDSEKKAGGISRR